MPDSLAESDTATVFTVSCPAPCQPPNPALDTTYSWTWGQVEYVHGLGIDQPLAVSRAGGGDSTFSIAQLNLFPHADWRGKVTAVSFDGGLPAFNGNGA